MRVLHVIHSMSPATGGPAEHLLQLSHGYKAIGTTMEVLTVDAPGVDFLPRYPFKIHTQGPGKSTFGYSSRAAQWLITHAHEYDGIVIDGLWFYLGIAARKASLKSRVPYVLFPHGMLDPWFRKTYPLKHAKKLLFWWLAQYRIVRDAKRVVFTTDAEQTLAKNTFSPYRASGAVVPLGISRPEGDPEFQKAACYEVVPALRGKRFLLFLSRIHEKKGCDLLLRAFAKIASQHPDLHLVMAGPGEAKLLERLHTLVAENHLEERVHWPGMLQGDVKWGAFHAADAFVLPSHQENFGMVVAEAIACGLPVLISDQVNIWPWIEEDGVGLVNRDTDEGTVQMLKEWLAFSAEERQAISDRSDYSYKTRFALDTCAQRIVDLLRV